MTDCRWEHFPHEADMGVRGYGATKEEAFEQAALAMTAVITDLHSVAPDKEIQVACESPDDEYLFTDWLNALIFEMATQNMLFSRFEVRLDGLRLKARAWGEEASVDKHHPAVEVKGATFTELMVKREQDGGWLAQCVVDV